MTARTGQHLKTRTRDHVMSKPACVIFPQRGCRVSYKTIWVTFQSWSNSLNTHTHTLCSYAGVQVWHLVAAWKWHRKVSKMGKQRFSWICNCRSQSVDSLLCLLDASVCWKETKCSCWMLQRLLWLEQQESSLFWQLLLDLLLLSQIIWVLARWLPLQSIWAAAEQSLWAYCCAHKWQNEHLGGKFSTVPWSLMGGDSVQYCDFFIYSLYFLKSAWVIYIQVLNL